MSAPAPVVQVLAFDWPTEGRPAGPGVGVLVDGRLVLWLPTARALALADTLVDEVERAETDPRRVPGMDAGLRRRAYRRDVA